MSLRFADVLGSFDAAAIAEGMESRRMIHLPQACGVTPAEIFSLEELERLILRDSMDPKYFRVSVNGHLPTLKSMGIMKDERLRPLVLRQLARQGASIILSEIQRYEAKFAALAADAERMLQDRVAIASIASFSRLPALPAHYDPQDIIIIQVEGTKVWRFLGESADCAVASHPRVKVPKDVSATVTMQAGDVMFVPAGLHHQCEADGVSLHVAIIVKHETLLDFLTDMFRRHPSLNRPLRPLPGRDSLERQVAALKADLVSRLEEADVADWLSETNAARASVTGLDLRGVSSSGSAEALAELMVTMLPPARPGRSWKVGGIDFEPRAGAIAVASALQAGPLPVRELLDLAGAEAGAEEARRGLDQLVGKGLVRIVPTAGADESS
jgi:hypothetical protein